MSWSRNYIWDLEHEIIYILNPKTSRSSAHLLGPPLPLILNQATSIIADDFHPVFAKYNISSAPTVYQVLALSRVFIHEIYSEKLL